jgi:hypothetical protein
MLFVTVQYVSSFDGTGFDSFPHSTLSTLLARRHEVQDTKAPTCAVLTQIVWIAPSAGKWMALTQGASVL